MITRLALVVVTGWVIVLLLVAGWGAQGAPTGPAGSGVLPTTVLEVSCLLPDDAALARPVMVQAQDGTRVEMWCGSRVEVTGGRCYVRIGNEVTQIPCVPGEAPGPGHSSGR